MLLPYNLFKDKDPETIVILGPGPSLSKEQIDAVRASNAFTIAIGDAGRFCYPEADLLYHAEAKWWNYYDGCPNVSSVKCCMEKTQHDDVYRIERSQKTEGLDFTFGHSVTGYNSGYQAVNIAANFTPRKILLIGYDMKDKPDGTHNVIGDHPKVLKRPTDFVLFRKGMQMLVKPLEQLGITVYNCSIDTALECFPKRELADVL